MKFDKNTIDRVSTLARLQLSDSEISEFTMQLSDILNYVDKISELDTSDVKPLDHIADQKNVFREDVAVKTFTVEQIAETAPAFEDGHFVVPKIIE